MQDQNPFKDIHAAGHASVARTLATAFAVLRGRVEYSEDVEEVFAALRFHYRMSGEELWPWLGGCHFSQYELGINETHADPSDVDHLRELAQAFLDEVPS